ncbi:glycosyltransferase family 4 protein [Chlorogloeopsis sp. ULAP02]|uniref:glycosyltransferase family 4 protein n=1 Tax=Chlorogloeopsis sp. ULAP02 TaxID=3107926 RepID=UPI00313598E5
MRLTLVISSLTSGGAERVMSIMANYWAAKGWTITLLTLPESSVSPFYNLDSRIQYVPLGIAGNSSNLLAAISNNLKRIQILRSVIVESKPDIVISFLDITNVLTLLATQKLRIPLVVDEQVHPAMYPIGKIWELLRQWTYLKADRVVAVTARALNYFSPQIQSHGCVIPNPALSVSNSDSSSTQLLVKPSLIAIGRLVPQKGFDLLLQAFAKLKDYYPEWTLTILGEGELRPELESLRDRLGLVNRVHLLGTVKNPHDYLKQADIFVMSSRFEGFPNALCEAMACGLPVISTDCPSGPKEIIRDGIDGILVPNLDESALATAMARLMSNEQERKLLAMRAPEVTERFSLEKVMGMWEALIEEVIKEKRK